MFIVNIFKTKFYLLFICLFLSLFSCTNNIHFSGINEKKYNQIYENYKSVNYYKDDIENIIGPPMVQEDLGNLWIYRLKKDKGNYTIKKNIYNKTLKLKFKNNVLESIEEIYLN